MSFAERVRRGEAQFGCCITYPSPGVVERIGGDWDWFWLDGQHGDMYESDLLALVRACDLMGKPALVRVASHEFGGIGRALDMGATGVIVPLVDTPTQAEAVVRAAKFPPLGRRSYGGRRLVDRGGRTYVDKANRDTLLVAQIESPEAIAHADAIAAVAGVDALFLGPDDVSLRRGRSLAAPCTVAALREDALAVADACQRHGKAAVTVAMSAEMQALCRDAGYTLVVTGADAGFLTGGSRRAATDARAVFAEVAAAEPLVPRSTPVGSPY